MSSKIKKRINFFSSKRGLSLLELMLYIGITGVMIAGMIQLFKTLNTKSKLSSTKTLVQMTKGGVDQFKIDLGRYPNKLEELLVAPSDGTERRRWQGPYVSEEYVKAGSIKDPFGNELEYKYDQAKQSVEVFSYGKESVGSDVGNVVAD